jgi:AcrR family transcriptional regulator
MRGDRIDRRTRRTRRLIGEALVALMVEQRYDRITVQDIIDRADVGRSTFYAHYRDKEDVLVSESERVLALFHQQLDPAGAGDQELLPSLGLFQHIGARHDLYHALVRGHGINVLYEACHRYLRISVGQRLAVLAPEIANPSIPLPVLADYVASTFLNLARWWLEQQRPYSPEQMDSIFQQLVLPGVRAGMGHTGAENVSSASHPQRHSPTHEKGREPQQKDRHRERA